MDQSGRRPKLLKDYAPPDYLVDEVRLDLRLDPKATRVTSKLRLRPSPDAEQGRPLVLDGEGLKLESIAIDGETLPAGKYRLDEKSLTIPEVPAGPFTLGDRDRLRPRGKHAALRPLPFARHLLHAMRAGRLPPHHLFPRPARRARRLHGPHRSRQGAGAGAAVERQSRRARRHPRHLPALRRLARSASEALLFIRAGRRQACLRARQLHHRLGPRGQARHLCRARQGGSLRLGDGVAEARHALGRAALRARIRSRCVQHRRRQRLQHGGDGEQGSQHLQRQAGAGAAGHGERRRLCLHRERHRA